MKNKLAFMLCFVGFLSACGGGGEDSSKGEVLATGADTGFDKVEVCRTTDRNYQGTGTLHEVYGYGCNNPGFNPRVYVQIQTNRCPTCLLVGYAYNNNSGTFASYGNTADPGDDLHERVLINQTQRTVEFRNARINGSFGSNGTVRRGAVVLSGSFSY